MATLDVNISSVSVSGANNRSAWMHVDRGRTKLLIYASAWDATTTWEVEIITDSHKATMLADGALPKVVARDYAGFLAGTSMAKGDMREVDGPGWIRITTGVYGAGQSAITMQKFGHVTMGT